MGLKSWRSTIAGDTADQFRAGHRAWAARIAAKLPGSLQDRILTGWDDRYGIKLDANNGSPVARANQFASTTVKDFGDARAGLAYDETAIKDHAENYAGMCARMKSRARRAQFAHWFGIDAPEGPRITDAGACARMDDPMWWRRQLRKVWTRRAEDAMRRAGVIRKGRAPYASDEAVRHRAARQRRTREWMESRVMVNGEGEQLELLKLADKSLSNPALRRGEFMCRMRGFEEIAADLGHVALFFTLTAPSAFHAQLSAGAINPKYTRATVRDAQQWLCKQWARARAKLARLSISFYGFRVAEPHHDATPHWHMLLFVRSQDAGALGFVLRSVWLSDYADEQGAGEHRCKVVTVDHERGSATGYVAKYVSKNIDGAGAIGDAISDETGERVSDGVARVAAWASCHGIRQFQQVGGPPVGLWRECRRVRNEVDADSIERVRAAADRGDWRGFIDELGGIERAKKRVRCISEKYRRECEVTPATVSEFPAVWIDRAAPRAFDSAGREVYALTRYGELPADRAQGVVAMGLLGRWASMSTRRHRWRIEKKCGISLSDGHRAPVASRSSDSFAATDGRCGAASYGSDSVLPPNFFSHLGPVAITVRGHEFDSGERRPRIANDSGLNRCRHVPKGFPTSDRAKYAAAVDPEFIPDPALAWIVTVPYREPKRAGPQR